MNIKTKLKPFQILQRFFPVWALKQQARIVSREFEADLKQAPNGLERQRIEFEQYVELGEYEEAIQTIHSRRLTAQARELFIYVTDLKWEEGKLGGRYLDQESLSRLFHAVKTQKDSAREFQLKFAGALTGIIGALIGLLAIWKK